MTHARVVNVRHPGATWDVYAGRGNDPRTGAPGQLGNPFDFRVHGREAMRLYLDDRARVLEEFTAFCREHLHGKTLGCWCAPKLCHAELPARLADGEDFETIRADLLTAAGLVERAPTQPGLFYQHEIRGISLTQPWASLVAIGAKTLETRSRSTPYRGWLAIHASKGFPKDCRALCSQEPFRSTLAEAGFLLASDLPLGSVLAVARLHDVHATNSPFLMPLLHARALERHFGDYGPNRFAYELTDLKRLRAPVPAKGSLPIGWHVSPELRAAIDQEIAAHA